MLNEATRKNLKRKSAYVDSVQLHNGAPLFSWVDLSLTELCNRSHGHPRACTFCPRIDSTFYPNQNLHMSMDLVKKITFELDELDYKGTVVLCGYGEPLLHPKIVEVVETLALGGDCRVEIVTNGDFLGPVKIAELRDAGLSYFVVSMYDGEHQVAKLKQSFKDAQCGEEYYLLRDRWHTAADQFGLKLTNRGGTVMVGEQDPVDRRRPCYYMTYQLQIDWNGDVLLCPQDWHKKQKMGNVNHDSLLDVWTSKRMHKRRTALIAGRRDETPCNNCNTDGTLHGENHVAVWNAK